MSDHDNTIEGPDAWFDRDAELELPHWSEATGEVQAIAAQEGGDWARGTGPRWRDGVGDYDESNDIRSLGLNAPIGQPQPGASVFPADASAGTASVPQVTGSAPVVPVALDGPAPAGGGTQSQQRFVGSSDTAFVPPKQGGGDRDLPMAIGTGVLLAAAGLAAFFLGEVWALALLVGLLSLAAVEFYAAVQKRGYEPATLLGIVAVAALPISVWFRGPIAYPIVLFLALVGTMLWYLLGISSSRPVPNVAITSLGILYVGLLGSFGALMLWSASAVPVNPDADPALLEPTDYTIEDHGLGLILAAVVVTAAYDIGAYFFGRSFGRSKLARVSPNKTIEGLIGGFVSAIAAALVLIGFLGVAPWGESPGGWTACIALGVVGAAAATLGDLCESMVKRDLGIKDMGTILPGHGGILDRFDGLLFVLPATWCTALVMGVIEPITS